MEYNSVKKTNTPFGRVEEDEKEIPKAESLKLKGSVSQKKQGLFGRTAKLMFPNGVKGIGSYLSKEVLLPGIQDLTWSAFTTGLSMLIYRDGSKTGSGHYRTGGSGGWNTPTTKRYTNYSSRTSYLNNSYSEQSFAPEESIDELIEYHFDNREDAVYALERVNEWVQRYGQIPVSEYYRMIDGSIITSYTMRSYGWNDLRGTHIRGVRGGKFIIDFPPLVDLQV